MTPDSPRLVYVVDDSAQVRASLTDLLRQLGHEAVAFDTGPKALGAIAKRPPSLALVDLRMLPMAGDELCKAMKENRALSKIPVIIFTAADSAHEVMRTWRAGADDFITKPITAAQLQQKLKALDAGSSPEGAHVHRPGERRGLLFVDDSRFFRTVLGGTLEQSGFRILYARNGSEALELARLHADELHGALTDLVMPGMDGVMFAGALKVVEGWADKPIMMMSGADDLDAERLARIEEVTGQKLLDKRVLPVEAIVAKVTASLQESGEALRAAERVPFFSVAEFRPAGATQFFTGFSYDVSPGGVFVRSLTPLPQGTAVELRVKLTMRLPIPPCFGQVVWANQYAPRTSFSYPVGMGIRFTHLEPDQRAEILKLVRAGGRMIAA